MRAGGGRSRESASGRTGAAGLAALLACAAAPAASEPEGLCVEAARYSEGAVRAVEDGATLLLEDGRRVRLAGIVAPGGFDRHPALARRAAGALGELVGGRRVALHGDADARDRYGRLRAQIVAGEGGAWVNASLVRAGMARASGTDADRDCTASLLAAERAARQAHAGVWAYADFAVMDAERTGPLLAAAGRFAVVAGVVRRVGEAGGRLFLDFGKRYTTDFTIVIARAAQKQFAAAGIDLRGLSGKRVRVRGVLHAWGGPAIEIAGPAALELLGTEADAPG